MPSTPMCSSTPPRHATPSGAGCSACFVSLAETLAMPAGIGSVLLLPELLSKPTREGVEHEATALAAVLARLDLLPVDEATARLAVGLGALYRLRSADAVHLATAVGAGADRFITNNQHHFPKAISEVDVVYPFELPELDISCDRS